MSNNFQEYVAYLDTHNAEPKPNPDDNSTNDVIIPCRFPNRLNVAQITLGSLEIPLAQYNIEDDWKILQFDEGIDLYVLDPSDESIVQFVINENGTNVIAQLPPRLNPITNVNPSGAPTNTAVFTTQYPHCLDLRGFFNWGEPMKVINTLLSTLTTPSGVNQLTTDNANLTIISDTEFQLTWTGAPVTFTELSSVYGYVSTPSIPSPDYLAQLVTLALEKEAPGHWKVTYDPCTGKFKLCWVGPGCDARTASPAVLVALGNNSLGHIMGFGCADVLIPMPVFEQSTSIIDKPREVPSISQNCIQSIECSPCRSQIEVDVGNYTPDGLMSNISRQLNRFYFDQGPGCGAQISPYTLYYSTQCGECKSLQIPFGLYSPDSLAAFLTTGMQANISSMNVSWDINTGQFTFEADVDFGLEFDANLTANNVELAYRLGFYPISYRNNNTYKSITPFYLPTKGCCGTSIPDRHLSYVYTPMPQSMLNNQKRFMVEVSKLRSIQTIGPFTNNADGTITITTRISSGPDVYIAHGFQVLDVVEVTVGGTDTYELTVVRVDGYNQFTVELGSIPATTFVNESSLCLRLSNAISTNLYFSCQPNNIMARTLGFGECDYLWSPSNPTTWIAPAMYCLDYPNYVLVEMTQPVGATHNMHAWTTAPDRTDTLTSILAKVILYPQFRMERSFPFHMIIPDLRVITRVQIRILNPDHSLYKLHNRDWSFTLVFHAVEKSINQLCY
jgi:hypothetical protein